MEYNILDRNGEAHISIYGNIKPSTRPLFLEMIEKLSQTSSNKWVLDISEVEFLDSSGLGMMVELSETAKQASASIAIEGANDMVMKMFKISKFETLFEIRE